MKVRFVVLLLAKVFCWNIISFIGLCLILLAIGCAQGRELLRVLDGNAKSYFIALGIPALLFSATCLFVSSVIASAGVAHLQALARESEVQEGIVLALSQFAIPLMIAAISFSAIAIRLAQFFWIAELIAVLSILFFLLRWFISPVRLSRLKQPIAALLAVTTTLFVAAAWSVWLVASPQHSREFGTLGVAIVAISLWTNILSLLFVAFPLHQRLPNMVLLVPLVWLGSGLIHDANLWPRHKSGAGANNGPSSTTLLKALNSWILQFEHGDSQEPIPVFMVSAEGGGMRAAYWTARTLAEVNERTVGQFSKHIFVYSGVSGGSLGVATFEDAARESTDPREVTAKVTAFLGRDFLAPLMSRFLITEPLWQIFGRLSGIAPRDVAFERQLHADWVDIGGSQFFAQSFISTYAVRASQPRPVIAFNSTNVETGKRLVVANASPAVVNTDFMTALEIPEVEKILSNASVAEIIHLSARFPYVSPPASLQIMVKDPTSGKEVPRLWGRAVDGGYFDNSAGLFLRDSLEELLLFRSYARRKQLVSQSGVDWERIRPLVARMQFYVLVIRNDPTDAWGKLVNEYPTLAAPAIRDILTDKSPDVFDTGLSAATLPKAASASELLAPPETVLNARDARAAATRRSLWETVSRSSDELSFQCEIEKRLASGRKITLPLSYSPGCIEPLDKYDEISLADIAVDWTQTHVTATCGKFRIDDISLGWTLSRKSQETMSCLASNSDVIRDVSNALVPSQEAVVQMPTQYLQASLPQQASNASSNGVAKLCQHFHHGIMRLVEVLSPARLAVWLLAPQPENSSCLRSPPPRPIQLALAISLEAEVCADGRIP